MPKLSDKDLKNRCAMLETELTNYMKFCNGLPDILYRVDKNGNFTYINSVIEKYGYTPEELTGSNISEIIHPDDRLSIRSHLTDEVCEKTNIEARLITKDNKAIPVEISSAVFFAQQPSSRSRKGGAAGEGTPGSEDFAGTQGVIRDISSRNNIDEERKKLAAIVESSTSFIGLSELDGTVIHINKAAREMIGLKPGEPPRKHIFDYVDEDFRKVLEREVLPKVMKDGA
ncbi:PAS domain-containing protein, partial [candidate division KSB1 bacterium]